MYFNYFILSYLFRKGFKMIKTVVLLNSKKPDCNNKLFPKTVIDNCYEQWLLNKKSYLNIDNMVILGKKLVADLIIPDDFKNVNFFVQGTGRGDRRTDNVYEIKSFEFRGILIIGEA